MEAIEAVHEGLVEAQDEKAARDRDMKALGLWRRFITKMRILDHVSRIPEEQEGPHHPMTMMRNNRSKAVEEGVVEVVEADEEEFDGFRGGFYSVSEGSELPISRKPTKKSQSLKQRCKDLCASPPLTFAAKATGKKAAKSKSKSKPKSTTTAKAKPGARRLPRRKVVIESDEEEEAEESEASDSNSSKTQRRNARSRKLNYKYNFDADSNDDYGGDDDAVSSGGGGGFLRQQENKVAPRRSTRLATTAKKATPVKYTVDDEDDDEDDDDEDGLEPELEKQQQGEEKRAQNNQKKGRASGGFLIESDNSSSELSDAPSDLMSEAEYETLVVGRAIEPNPALEKEGHDSGGFFTEGLEGQDHQGDDGDDEDEGSIKGDGDAELRSAMGVFETPHRSCNDGDLGKTDYVMRGIGPIAGDGAMNTSKTDQEMTDYNGGGDDHNDNDIAVGKSLLVGNEVGEAQEVVVGPIATSPDTMAGLEKMHHEGQAPSGGSSPMLSEDPEDKDNTDFDWCNYE